MPLPRNSAPIASPRWRMSVRFHLYFRSACPRRPTSQKASRGGRIDFAVRSVSRHFGPQSTCGDSRREHGVAVDEADADGAVWGPEGGEIAPAAKRMWLQIQTLEAEALEVGNPVDLGCRPDAWTCGGSASSLSAHDVTRYEPPMSPRPINAR